MNLIEAKQWVQSKEQGIDVRVSSHPQRLNTQLKRCFRIFSSSKELSYRERIQWLNRLKVVLISCSNQDALISRIQKKRESLIRIEQSWKCSHEYEMRINEGIKRLSKHLFIHHAVLDSSYEESDEVEGMSCLSALQLFLDELHLWNKVVPGKAINQLTSSFEVLEELMICLLSHWTAPKIFRREYELQFLQKIKDLLFLLSQKVIPYFFLPVHSEGHAMVGRVEWSDTQGYRLTIINTISEGGYFDETAAYESIYEKLSEAEMISVSQILLMEWPSVDEVYRGIENLLPVEKREAEVGKRHRFQKGNSCSVKSLIATMHSTLNEKDYRAFKAFYTSNLLGNYPDFPKQEAARKILQKRVRKGLIGNV